jgi:hypothetical protein
MIASSTLSSKGCVEAVWEPSGSRDGFKRGVRLFLVARPQKTTRRSLAAPHSESIKVRCCAQETYFPALQISN